MDMKKHALVLFTKSPQPGATKTRLTEKHGGPLTEQEAADLYRAMMLDVAAVAFRALETCRQSGAADNSRDEYDFFISCTPESEEPKLRTIFEAEFPNAADIHYVIDRGRNFDEHFNDTYRQLFGRGYYSVVCIGGDLPTICPEFIHHAFQWLTYLGAQSGKGAMVVAPCQEGGVSLVGLTADALMDFTGVFYNTDGIAALDAITSIAATHQIPMALLEPMADIDHPEDLAHAIAVLNAMVYASFFQPDISLPRRTLSWVQETGFTARTSPGEEHKPGGTIDD